MAITTTSYLLVGTGTADESATLTAIANNATNTPATVDLLGDDTSMGEAELFLILTSTVTVGTVDIRINPQRDSGVDYAKVSYERQVVPTNGTQRIPLGRRPVGRYASADVLNNATGASCSVAIVAKVVKVS